MTLAEREKNIIFETSDQLSFKLKITFYIFIFKNLLNNKGK